MNQRKLKIQQPVDSSVFDFVIQFIANCKFWLCVQILGENQGLALKGKGNIEIMSAVNLMTAYN